jgi:hypothetical protein
MDRKSVKKSMTLVDVHVNKTLKCQGKFIHGLEDYWRQIMSEPIGSNKAVIDISEYTPEELKHYDMCGQLNDRLGNLLCKEYPGYPWGVSSNIWGGIVDIHLGFFNAGRAPLGMTIKLDDSMLRVERKVIHYAGELLERYAMVRGSMNEVEVLESKKDWAGRIEVDES